MKKTVSEYDVMVGKRLRYARTLLDLTQRDIAHVVGVTTAAICDYERGRIPLKARVVRGLCETYGISSDWLLGITDDLTLDVSNDDGTYTAVVHSTPIPLG